MSDETSAQASRSDRSRIEDLENRLAEAEATLWAIQSGQVDALVVEGPNGSQVFTLKGAEHPYRRFVEAMSEGAATVLPDGTIVYCNKRLALMLDTPLQNTIGSTIYGYVRQADRGAVEELLRSVAGAQERGENETNRVELDLLKGFPEEAKGEQGTGEEHRPRVPAYLSASSVEIDDAEAVCLVVTDLTEQKRNEEIVEAGKRKLAEEQLKANKLESIGILAGGLAHDLNNALTSVLGNIALVRRSLLHNETLTRRLAEAEAASLQAREVTQQLLTFAKGGLPVRNTVALPPLLKEWVSFAMAGSNVACEFRIAEDLRPVDIDAGQIGRVINNLLINAQQAMPGGGKILVEADNIVLGPEQLELRGLHLKPGNYVKIAVTDRGTGISEADLPRIFDPYFTTKQEGSGLGLAISYSVTRGHGGNITVESVRGEGSTFTVYLPAAHGTTSTDLLDGEEEPVQGLRVLVMDDQETIRSLVGQVLRELEGHEVSYACDGVEAAAMYNSALEKGEPFDIVLMDLTIAGGMGGKEAVKRLLEIDPSARVIVFSGYSNDPIMASYRSYGFSGVLRKPFEIEELLAEVHRVANAG